MTKASGAKQTPKVIPLGKYIGRRIDRDPKNKGAHFIKCQTCGGWIDMRDLGEVLAHEGPLPHPSEDRPQ
jgi:hypothetical protein